MDLLRDSIWTFVGAAIAFMALIAMAAISWWQKEKKRISVQTIASFPLLDRDKTGIEGLSITYHSRQLDDALVLLLRVSCTGNKPILAADFETPISLEFSDESEVLAADVVETEPSKLPVDLQIHQNMVTMSPALLNPGDNVTCRLLVHGGSGKYERLGRVAGVKTIDTSPPTSILAASMTILGASLFFGAMVFSPNAFVTEPEEVPYVIAATIGMIAMAIGAASNVKSTFVQARISRRGRTRWFWR